MGSGTPLLNDSTSERRRSLHQHQSRPSTGSQSSSRISEDSRISRISTHETHNTHTSSSNLIDHEIERGEAPPYAYFEVVEVGPPLEGMPARSSNNGESSLAGSSPSRLPSAFRRFLPWFSSAPDSNNTNGPVLPTTTTPMQQVPQTSVTMPYQQSSTLQAPQQPSSSSSNLRASPSQPSLRLFQTRSRSNSVNPSASTTSLVRGQAISSPLPNSLVHASYAYPTAGPTAEQMKFVSSTQSLIRFGVPVGADGASGSGSGSGGGAEAPPPSFAEATRNRSTSRPPARENSEETSSSNPESSSTQSQTTPVSLFVPPTGQRITGRVDTAAPSRQQTSDSEGQSSMDTDVTPVSLFISPMASRPPGLPDLIEPSTIPIPETPSSSHSPSSSKRPDSFLSLSEPSEPTDSHRRESTSTVESFATADTHVQPSPKRGRGRDGQAAVDSGDETETEDTIIGHQENGGERGPSDAARSSSIRLVTPPS